MSNEAETIETLRTEITKLQQRIQELEQQNQELQEQVSHTKAEKAWVYRLLEQVPIAIVFMRGQDHVIEFANTGYYTLVGERELIGQPLAKAMPELVEQGFINMLDNVYQTGESFSMNEVFVRIDRHQTGAFEDSWHRFGWQPTRDANGTIDGVFYYGIDITDQVSARHEVENHNERFEHLNNELEGTIAELQQNQTLLQKIMDTLPASIYVVDTDGYFIKVNQKWVDQFHFQPEQVIGKGLEDLFEPNRAAKLHEQRKRVLATGETLTNEEQITVDDEQRIFLSAVSPLYDGEGNTTAVVGISTDITERKKAEEETLIFKALVENAPDAISVSDTQGTILFANASFKDLLGYGEATIGMPVPSFNPPSEADTVVPAFEQVMEQGNWQGELMYQRADQTIFPGLASAFLVHDSNKNVQAVGAIVRDLSEQQKAEEERSILQQQIIDAQQSAIRELSSPLIPLTSNIVLMPLIGSIDSQRAQLVMETLLEGVSSYQADMAILDITGVSVVDTQVANALVQAAQAVKLLGAQVVLTGIGPTMAQTLVHLGADLSIIQTRGSLQSGIAYAMAQ